MPESLARLIRSLFTELGPNPKQNIHIIVGKTAELLKCESAAYGYIEAATGDVRFRAAHKIPDRPSRAREKARRICREIISDKGAGPLCEFGPDGHGKMLTARHLAKTGFKSFLGHPVTVDGQNTGALIALNTQHREFSEHDRALITILAGIVAIEESRYRREEALSRRVSLEEMLNDLSAKSIAIEETAAFTEHFLRMLGSRMGVGGSFFWKFNPRKKTLSNTYEWLAESKPPQKPNLQDIPVDSLPWAFGQLMKGEVLKINDARSIPARRERELLEQIGVRACLGIPLFSKDAFYGFIGLECYTGPKFWVSEDILVLQTAAEIMMRYIENKRLEDELVAKQQGLERAVAQKTSALLKTNQRLLAEIAAHKKAISNLKQRETELADNNKTFMELNNALVALVSERETDLAEAEESAILKINRMIDPAGTNLFSKGSSKVEGKYIGNLRGRLKELSSLLKTKSTLIYQCLTPAETQVANLIKQGMGNKEIADLLNLSRRTIEVHRYNIRKKLQLDKTKMNLKTYLSTIE